MFGSMFGRRIPQTTGRTATTGRSAGVAPGPGGTIGGRGLSQRAFGLQKAPNHFSGMNMGQGMGTGQPQQGMNVGPSPNFMQTLTNQPSMAQPPAQPIAQPTALPTAQPQYNFGDIFQKMNGGNTGYSGGMFGGINPSQNIYKQFFG